jgi:carboxyl-terminal processing protease
MTTPQDEQDRGSPGSRPGQENGVSVGAGAMVLLAISAAVVFWAGLSLGSQTAGRSDAERVAIEAFTETYQRISDEYVGETEPGALLEGAICGMFETLDDPYSVCMGADEYVSRFEDISGEFGGIGAVMNTEDADGGPCALIGDGCGLRVVEVLAGTPAFESGLAVGDRVSRVDGSPIDGLTITDSVSLIRGPRGSDVRLTVERGGEQEVLLIRRELITTSDVRSAVLGDGRVGYLRLDSFSANAANDFSAALRSLIESGVQDFVVDVRDDPGGFVDAAVAIASQFIDEGAVFWEEDASSRQVSVDVIPGGLATDPEHEVVILINEGSASASEILAGALQDAGRARLVGRPTFGKGTVQEWTQLPGENGGFRLSVAKWLTRNKTWIDSTGLTPDVEVASSGRRYNVADGSADPGADAQLDRALRLLLVGDDVTPQGSATPPDPPLALEQ